MPHAYIPFTPERPGHLEVINAYLHGQGIYPIGRFGEWKYVNQDGAILSAKRVVESVQAGECPGRRPRPSGPTGRLDRCRPARAIRDVSGPKDVRLARASARDVRRRMTPPHSPEGEAERWCRTTLGLPCEAVMRRGGGTARRWPSPDRERMLGRIWRPRGSLQRPPRRGGRTIGRDRGRRRRPPRASIPKTRGARIGWIPTGHLRSSGPAKRRSRRPGRSPSEVPPLGPARPGPPLLRDRGGGAVPDHRPERRPDLARAGRAARSPRPAVRRPAPRLAEGPRRHDAPPDARIRRRRPLPGAPLRELRPGHRPGRRRPGGALRGAWPAAAADALRHLLHLGHVGGPPLQRRARGAPAGIGSTCWRTPTAWPR